MGKKWFPLESNPEVMNKYLCTLGVAEPAVEFIDVFCTDVTALGVPPTAVLALLFVYPVTADSEEADRKRIVAMKDVSAGFQAEHTLFFSEQTVSNACGTMAILHALLNNCDSLGALMPDSTLAFMKTAVAGVSPEACGTIIEGSDMLDEAHQEAASEGATANQDIDADIQLHFVCYVHVGGHCVELDGRKPYPLVYDKCDASAFAQTALAVIQRCMDANPNSLEFNILALVKK